MATYPLSESFDASGEWYMPENPQRIIAGRLHYTPDRTELHLNDTLQPLHGSIRADSMPLYSVVYGTTSQGEATTLLKAQRMGVSLNLGSGGMRQPERLISSLLLIGAHMPPGFAYPKVSFRIPALQVWLSRPIIEQIINHDQTAYHYSHTYRVQTVEIDKTSIPSINATLEWGIGWNSNADHFSSIAVQVSAWITIRPTSPQVIEWYFEQQGKLAAMLAFLAGTPMSPDCIEASVDDSHHKVSVMVAMRDKRVNAIVS